MLNLFYTCIKLKLFKQVLISVNSDDCGLHLAQKLSWSENYNIALDQ